MKYFTRFTLVLLAFLLLPPVSSAEEWSPAMVTAALADDCTETSGAVPTDCLVFEPAASMGLELQDPPVTQKLIELGVFGDWHAAQAAEFAVGHQPECFQQRVYGRRSICISAHQWCRMHAAMGQPVGDHAACQAAVPSFAWHPD